MVRGRAALYHPRMMGGQLPAARERRQSPRIRVVLPVTFGSMTGWTRDVSTAGVFFTFADGAAKPPDAGAQIWLGLVLEHADPRGLLEVRCEGSVVRVENTVDAAGVAVRFLSYQFDPADIAASPAA
jgi:PilZ domain-containing protein